MGTLKTGLRAAQYDSLRRSTGIIGDLTIHKAIATGYESQVTITAGWFAQRERDNISGEQFLAVRIVMTNQNVELLTTGITNAMAACAVQGLRYKIKSKVAPLGDPGVWTLLCDPTGEAA